MAHDILIKSGTILDGTGSTPTTGDVAIDGDKISAVGKLGNASAKIAIDASGKYITPGFVDITNHSDTHLTIFKYPVLDSLTMQGITTAIGGNCGASLAPLGSLQAIQTIKKWVDPQEINVNWGTYKEFLNEISRVQPGVNFGSCVGFGTLRRGVIGDESRALTQEEKEKVKLLLSDAMSQGAFGLSLGLAYGHERIAPVEEIIEIAKVLQATGGMLKIHLRSEGGGLVASINETVRIGREAGVPIQISHLKAIGRKAWPHFKDALELISHAQNSGLDINFDVSPYASTGSSLYSLIPGWARYGGFGELFRRLDDPVERQKIVDELKASTFHYDRILITSANVKQIVGRTLAQVAEEAGLTPEEALLEAVRANEGRVSIAGQTVSLRNTARAIEHELAFISTNGEGLIQDSYRSGNLAHPRSFGALPHFWHKFVTDLKRIPAERAITKITSSPAAKLKLIRRGTLLEGNYADIAVFDPQLFRDRSNYQNPYRYPAGISWVLVNGVVVVEDGRQQSTRAGRVLKRGEE